MEMVRQLHVNLYQQYVTVSIGAKKKVHKIFASVMSISIIAVRAYMYQLFSCQILMPMDLSICIDFEDMYCLNFLTMVISTAPTKIICSCMSKVF